MKSEMVSLFFHTFVQHISKSKSTNLKIGKLVKNNIKHVLRLIAGSLLLVVIISACNEASDLGLEILPGEDLINVKHTVIKDDISAFTANEESLISSGGTSLMGSFNDPLFGSTDIDFAAQFRLTSYPAFGTNPVVDSVKLFLYYKGVYGDTITAQNFKVYELEEDLDADEDYTQDIDLKSMASDQLLGEISYTPKVKIDTTSGDTLYQLITIPLDASLGEKLVNLDSTVLSNVDSFLSVFKGLYIDSEKISDDVGGLLTLAASSSSSFQGSAMLVYYDNDENIALGTEADTLSRAFIITEYSARVNSIVHDYSTMPSYANLNQEIVQDDYLFIQPTGGLKAKILIDNLESWKDSVTVRGNDTIKYAINKAELIFQTDTTTSKVDEYAPPVQLLITFIDDEGDEKLPIDYYFSPTFYGGYLYSNYQYRFNITQHMQAIIDGEVGNNGFYLSTGRRTHYANRVVVEGTSQATGIQFEITYSKFLE